MSLQTVFEAPRRERKPASLFQFLTKRGGLKPHPDLTYLLNGTNGWMIRRKGMTLDRAREAAVEAGYLQDCGWHSERESDSTINDLLELISAEARGFKQYPAGYYETCEIEAYDDYRDEEEAGELAPAGQATAALCRPARAPRKATMTNTEYRTAIEKLGLTITGAGPVLGLGPRQAQRIAAGHCPVPETVAKLLRLALRFKVPAEKI